MNSLHSPVAATNSGDQPRAQSNRYSSATHSSPTWAPSHRIGTLDVRSVLFLLATFAVALAPGAAQDYTYQLGPGESLTTAGTSSLVCSDPNISPQYSFGTGSASFPPTGALPSPLASSGGAGTFVQANGQWRPATVSYISSDLSSIGITSLDSSGMLSTYVSQAGTSLWGGPDMFTAMETIDLQTGKWIQSSQESISYSGIAAMGPPPCGTGVAGVYTDNVQISGSWQVTSVPVTAQPILAVLNPYACALQNSSCTATPSSAGAADEVTFAPAASAISADGGSAAVIMFQTNDPNDSVVINVTGPADFSGPIGSLSSYDPNFLNEQLAGITSGPLTLGSPNYCDSQGNCIFLALLWAPTTLSGGLTSPITDGYTPIPLTISATQGVLYDVQTSIMLLPPPLVLVHGIWSSAAEWMPFHQWLDENYPHNLIVPADYGPIDFVAFSDPRIENIMQRRFADALMSAGLQKLVARQVDVVGHSMGGLVTRYYMANPPAHAPSYLPPNPVHQLLTIGTPHTGSALAATLWNNRDNPPVDISPFISIPCALVPACTLEDVFAYMGKPVSVNGVESGVQSLEPGNQNLPPQPYKSIVGQAPDPSCTGILLNTLINAFVPGNTVDGLLGNGNDTIVGANSQSYGAQEALTEPQTVHESLCGTVDTGETVSQAVWTQTAYWLMGGTGPLQNSASPAKPAVHALAGTNTASLPVVDLTGYTQVAASNVAFFPASGSTLTINSITSILATSPTKTITEILLFQAVADPTDIPLLYSTQLPFTLSFTPTRLGSANFIAFAVFNDNTFAATTLSYSLQPFGKPLALSLPNAPVASMPVGTSATIAAQALFSNGYVDVSQAATYKVRSGASSVISVDSTGLVTANGAGVDWLDISYNGVNASTQIAVGSCSYALGPRNQLVDVNGGAVSVQVTAPTGCAWTADAGRATWLTLLNASGSGSGTITLTAGANTSGFSQTAILTVAGQDVAIIQPGSSCTYTFDQTPLRALATGLSGSLPVATACPIVASSNAAWITVTPLATSVAYFISPNSGPPRMGTLTVGTQELTVTEAGTACTLPVTTVSVTGPSGNAGWYVGPVQVTLTAADAGAPIAQTLFTVDGGVQMAYKAAFTVSGDAVHQVAYYSTAACGLQENPNLLTIKIDDTPPVTSPALSGPKGSNGWYRGPVTIIFSAADNLSGVATTMFSTNNGATWTGGTSVTLSTDGVFSVLYHSMDLAGNTEAVKSIQVMVDQTPPLITAAANPPVLWPPSGEMVAVVISGTITDNLSGVSAAAAAFVVKDSYGLVQPSGPVTLGANGSYAVTVLLESRRNGNDPNGRLYTITVTGQDNAGNASPAMTSVMVPHDQGN